MGWCSATDLMDTALAAAEAAVQAALSETDCPEPSAEQLEARVDAALRPFVAKLAEVLRDNDWDCVDESDYFDQFPQEMLGHNDQEHLAWLVKNVKDSADYQDGELGKWTTKLVEHQRKMEGK